LILDDKYLKVKEVIINHQLDIDMFELIYKTFSPLLMLPKTLESSKKTVCATNDKDKNIDGNQEKFINKVSAEDDDEVVVSNNLNDIKFENHRDMLHDTNYNIDGRSSNNNDHDELPIHANQDFTNKECLRIQTLINNLESALNQAKNLTIKNKRIFDKLADDDDDDDDDEPNLSTNNYTMINPTRNSKVKIDNYMKIHFVNETIKIASKYAPDIIKLR
jgi:hypothetical protein